MYTHEKRPMDGADVRHLHAGCTTETYIYIKRPTCMKRDVYTWKETYGWGWCKTRLHAGCAKETYIYVKRPICMEIDVYTWKETYGWGWCKALTRRMYHRDIHIYKETYVYENRCIHMKRDAWMGLMQGTYDVPKRHIYIGRDSIYNTMMYAHEKRRTHIHAGCADSTCTHCIMCLCVYVERYMHEERHIHMKRDV